jgi:hypothetical protein
MFVLFSNKLDLNKATHFIIKVSFTEHINQTKVFDKLTYGSIQSVKYRITECYSTQNLLCLAK